MVDFRIFKFLQLRLIFFFSINSIIFEKNYTVINVTLNGLVPLLQFLKSNIDFQCKQLIDLNAVDYFGRKFNKRFEVYYLILSLKYKERIMIKVSCEEKEVISSISNIYCNATWFEREIWDMFGLFFVNQKDLRRILSDYGFQGYPLRKDFPLTGYLEVRYDDEQKRLVYEPLEITQEFRVFQFPSPWKPTIDVSKLEK